jgi:hypothetical protein
MTPKRFLLLASIVSLGILFAFMSPTQAQELGPTPTPPPVETPGPPPLTETSSLSPSVESPGLSPAAETPSPPSTFRQAPAAAADEVLPLSGEIPIATTSDLEGNPAVAVCATDQYLAVYARGGDIYGQRVNADGQLLGSAFVIYDGSNAAYAPDVACDWVYNRFIVVWTYLYNGTDTDLYVQAVYGAHQSSGSQLAGSRVTVASQTRPEQNPAIACNSLDFNCLIVYEYDGATDDSIYGQRLTLGSSALSLLGTSFDFTSPMTQTHPTVAWNGVNDNYLVVWQEAQTSPKIHQRVFFAHVYPTDQGSSDERQHNNTFLINPGTWDCNQLSPDVAYNRYTNRFLVAFEFDYLCNGTDYDILARRVGATGSIVQGGPFWVAWDGTRAGSPSVAFSGGPLPFGEGADQYLVTYTSELNGQRIVYGQPVKGTHDPIVTDQQNDGPAVEIDSMAVMFGWYLLDPDVTGTINNGRYLTVWQYETGGTGYDDDVLGRLYTPPLRVFLPFVLR